MRDIHSALVLRLRVARQLLWRPLFWLGGTAWFLLQVLLFVRDEVLRPENVEDYLVLSVLPNWTPWVWITFALAFLLLLAIEGAIVLPKTGEIAENRRDQVIGELMASYETGGSKSFTLAWLFLSLSEKLALGVTGNSLHHYAERLGIAPVAWPDLIAVSHSWARAR